MNYYTSTISADLANKLKEKGMLRECILQDGSPIIYDLPQDNPLWADCKAYFIPSYAEVFDWLMEKGIRITLHTYPAREPFAWGYRLWAMDGGIIYDPNPAPEIMKLDCHPTWHEAANAAIEKALTLI